MTAPFSARRAVQMVVEDVERVANAIRASGMPVTEAHYELLLEACVREAMKELPKDAQRYFAVCAIRDELDSGVDDR
jgi:hypothetical protein